MKIFELANRSEVTRYMERWLDEGKDIHALHRSNDEGNYFTPIFNIGDIYKPIKYQVAWITYQGDRIELNWKENET